MTYRTLLLAVGLFFFSLPVGRAQDNVVHQIPSDVPRTLAIDTYPVLDRASIRPLTIGDKVPDVDLGEVLKMPGKTRLRISDFKGRLLILDFWSVWCATCIAQFPKMDALQKEFGDRIAIIPVGFDGREAGSIRKFLQKRQGTKLAMQLPTTIQAPEDKVLEELFPFDGLPHEVWIDPNGTVVGITDHLPVSSENIQAVLAGKTLEALAKKKWKNITKEDEFLIPHEAGSRVFKYYGSAFSGFIDGLTNSWQMGLQYDSSFYRIYHVNRSIYDYYNFVYSSEFAALKEYPRFQRYYIENGSDSFYKDISMVESAGWDENEFYKFLRKNTFCYEVVMPRFVPKDSVRGVMRQDLDRFLGLESKVADREVSCYVLNVQSPRKLKKSVLTAPRSAKDLSDLDHPKLKLTGVTINDVRRRIETFCMTPVIVQDESGYTGRIDITLPLNATADDFRRTLEENGIEMRTVTRTMPMLVLKSLR